MDVIVKTKEEDTNNTNEGCPRDQDQENSDSCGMEPAKEGDTEIDGDGDGGVDSVTESLAQAKLDEQKEQVVVAEAADTLQDMDSAIRGIRDWQKQHSEEVAKLERVHQDLLEELTTRKKSNAGGGEAEDENKDKDKDGTASTSTSGSEEAAAADQSVSSSLGLGRKNKVDGDGDDLYSEFIREMKMADEKVQGLYSNGKVDSHSTTLSEEKLKLLTSASGMSFKKKENTETAAKASSCSSILEEADKLLQSLASEDAGVGEDAASNDAIAWSSDLQSVLSKLDMLERDNT